MTDRLREVEARIGNLRQLSAVITAMRGIAAAHSREAEAQLAGIRTYAATIGSAIGEALAFLAQQPRTGAEGSANGHLILALCAEQGFAGTFSERVLDAAAPLLSQADDRGAELLLVGERGLILTEERALPVGWSAPMAAHSSQVAALADRIVDALYERIEAGRAARVTVVHARPASAAAFEIATKILIPFDFARFPLPPKATAPLITLPPQRLIARLAEEYVFAELCEALMQSFAAENAARMQAMIAARANIAEKLDGLLGQSRLLRQEEITNEIIELAGTRSSG
ncbi:F0F1 ATP synthase subunit gamma [Propylenella binzhouense]|uniref:F-type H+-transporting ATPase subunit gamma n=1 Tax=Propylenella binzhouense TaxID=2555902 RepID=A0A964T7V1_9HYPH|nr:FoF1 ATP synthase subunit gamma [Propylenella binzhouense]MYZ48972.1 hypothetical protein [Propylenella binzhouense]